MRSVCKTNIEKALRKSLMEAERNHWYFEDVNDDWQAGIGFPTFNGIYEAELWNWHTEETLTVRFTGCYTAREVIEYAAYLLLDKYERRHGRLAA